MASRILLPLFTYPDASPDMSVRSALGLAASLEARVSALVHEVIIPPVTEPLALAVLDITAMSEAAEKLSRSRGAQLAALAREEAARLGMPIELSTLRADRSAGDAIAAVARTHDYTFLTGLAHSPDHAMLIEDILFGAGGPVIVFPSEAEPARLDTVAVAWDGSRAAARALRDAVPVLKRARRVMLLSVTDDKAIPAGTIDSAVAFLDGHAISAGPLAITRTASTIGDALQNRALDQGAGLLVMGAYGHSRLREFILGGATQSILNSPRLPVLMSH